MLVLLEVVVHLIVKLIGQEETQEQTPEVVVVEDLTTTEQIKVETEDQE